MLAPDSVLSRVIMCVLLAALLALLVWRAVRKDRREYQDFKALQDTVSRQRVLRKWVIESLLFFGGSAAVILLLVWQFVPRMLAQVERYPVTLAFRHFVADSNGVFVAVVIGVVIAAIAGSILFVVLLRNSTEIPTIGDIGALLPRNRHELGYGVALSLNAGVMEELLFRLAVPALVFGVTGNAATAIVASVLLFAALHLYQGAAGIVGALAIGALLMLIYLATGSILWPILAHALIDLRSLVLIPMVIYRVHRVSGRADVDVEDDPAEELPEPLG
jgi:membrane protease YdiL (CAAX protease family)